MDEILSFSCNIEANEVTNTITSSANVSKLDIFHKTCLKLFLFSQNPSFSLKYIVLIAPDLLSSPALILKSIWWYKSWQKTQEYCINLARRRRRDDLPAATSTYVLRRLRRGYRKLSMSTTTYIIADSSNSILYPVCIWISRNASNVYYGNTGCGVSSPGIQNPIDISNSIQYSHEITGPLIKVFQRILWYFWNGGMVSLQNLGQT